MDERPTGEAGHDRAIRVLLADDNLLIREGVRALLALEDDIEVVADAGDFDELLAAAEARRPDVVVTDIRMPPGFGIEGIEAAKQVRHQHPGTGVVILSQYDDPDYALAVVGEGASGWAYLLKDRVADGDRLVRAIREVVTGGSMLDPTIVGALLDPARTAGSTEDQPTEEADLLSRLMPGGLADRLRVDPTEVDRTERVTVTVLMSDVRGYSRISEHTDPTVLAAQLNEHRAAMNRAIIDEGGCVMGYAGDAVMAVFGPLGACPDGNDSAGGTGPTTGGDHAERAARAARTMHLRQQEIDRRWIAEGLAPFGLGIGISTGEVVAAVLGSEERLEYTVVGDTVNLADRLQDLARPAGETVISERTWAEMIEGGAGRSWDVERLDTRLVKGRNTPVTPLRLLPSRDPGWGASSGADWSSGELMEMTGTSR